MSAAYCQICGMRTIGGVYACGHSPTETPDTEMLAQYFIHKIRCTQCGDEFLPSEEGIADQHIDHSEHLRLLCTPRHISDPAAGFWMDFLFFAKDYKGSGKPN